MSESDDVLSLRGGETLPKSAGKSCPNRKSKRPSSSLWPVKLSCGKFQMTILQFCDHLMIFNWLITDLYLLIFEVNDKLLALN